MSGIPESVISCALGAREKKEIGGRPQAPAKGLPPLRTLLLPDFATALKLPKFAIDNFPSR
jgi:hypothetical protein